MGYEEQIILFGCGAIGREALDTFGKQYIYCFCDNNKTIVGTMQKGKMVISFQQLKQIHANYIIVVCANEVNKIEIMELLEDHGISNYQVFGDHLRWKLKKMSPEEFVKNSFNQVAKIKNLRNSYKEQIGQLSEQLEYLKKFVDVRTMKTAAGYLRKKQMDSVHFATEFFNKVAELHIHPILCGGSLLGYVYRGGFMPWEDELSFCLFRDDYERLFDYCKKKYPIEICENSDLSGGICWEDKVIKKHRKEIVLFEYHNKIRISRGSSWIDRLFIDIRALDFYEEDYSFSDHKKHLEILKKDLEHCKSEKERVDLIRSERGRKWCVAKESSYIYFGIDNGDSFEKTFNKGWIPSNIVFPLKKAIFEGEKFFVPQNSESIVEFFYKDSLCLPNDVGIEKQDCEGFFLQGLMISIEFYLVDTFEISHFEPFYHFFRSKGAYAVFVAEPCRQNTSGKWFDYDEAVVQLDKKCLQYKTVCNPDAHFVFSTQASHILRKYGIGTKKINLQYGCSLLKNIFSNSLASTEGFDYKFVHGQYAKEVCKQFMSEDKIKIVGYPRYYGLSKRVLKAGNIRKELGIATDKPILCYMPTWDEYASMRQFRRAFLELRKNYFILTKPHHCTYRLEEKKGDLEILNEISDIVLEASYDFEKVSIVGDLVLVDARSGATLEASFVNPDVKMIWLAVNQNLDSIFEEQAFHLAKFVSNPDELVSEVVKNCSFDSYMAIRKKEIYKYFERADMSCLEKVYNEMIRDHVELNV